MIGSLLYLTASRPDIIFNVCMCARYQAMPMEPHMIAINRILRYLEYTPCLGLWYPKGARFQLVGYSDSDYAGCHIDRKSTSGGCHFLGSHLSLGCQRNKIVLPCQRLRWNKLLLVLLVHKYFI